MTTLGDRLGQGARPDLGAGYSIPPEQQIKLEALTYPEFHEGIDLSEAPEEVRDGGAVMALDMELTSADELIRSPGIVQLSDESPRLLTYMFEQSSLDYIAELLAVDPPWFGYKGSGAFTWVNAGIAATNGYGWNALNYLGYLLFSNGVDATYSRNTGAAVLVDQTANVIARTMATTFGRKFAGHYTTGGAAQALGIKWDDTTATVGGWSGTGSGTELLISNTGSPDYIVALRPLGFDLLAILNRKSLWAGYRTNIASRPADFKFRFGGVGCVHERTAVVGPGCVTFLSDEGVVNYTVNDAAVISGPINPELLPLAYGQLEGYCAAYQAVGRRYYLSTPDAIWIYEYPVPELKRPGRWFKRGLTVDAMVSFTDQASLVTWDQLIGSWDSQILPWNQIQQASYGSPAPVYFGQGSLLGREDPTINTHFGVTMQSQWRTKQVNAEMTSDQFTTHGFEIEYASDASSTVSIKTQTANEVFTNAITRTLPSTAGIIRRRTVWGLSSGVGVQAQIEVSSGSPRIKRIRQIVERVGPSMGATITI